MVSPARDWLRHPAIAPIAIGLSVVLLAASAFMVVKRGIPWPAAALNGQSLTASHTVVAYIVGAVAHPGIYTLPDSDRVNDLVQAAGGAWKNADLVRVNLAALLYDGEEVYVPLIGEPFPSYIGGTGIKVNLNLATATTLRQQLGLSSKTADAIIVYRQQHGPFTAVDQLLLVPISRTIYDRIKDLVTV